MCSELLCMGCPPSAWHIMRQKDLGNGLELPYFVLPQALLLSFSEAGLLCYKLG